MATVLVLGVAQSTEIGVLLIVDVRREQTHEFIGMLCYAFLFRRFEPHLVAVDR